ncbi:MAG: helix-turn-helix domain-containing protein [Devosia sp.]
MDQISPISAREEPGSLLDGRFFIERHIADSMGAAHWHSHVELNLLESGSMTYLFNGRRERVEAGRLVLFWAAIPHRTVEVVPGSPLICAYVPLAEFLAQPLDAGFKRALMQGQLLTAPAPDEVDGAVARRWLADWDSGDVRHRQLVADEVMLRVRRFSLAADMGEERAARSTGSRQPTERVEVLIELVHGHFAEPLSVTRLGQLAGIHPSTAETAFRRVLGISVNEYLLRYRLSQALHRLADSDETILDIAFACGFGSASRFYGVFKERTGTTPRQFRARMRG